MITILEFIRKLETRTIFSCFELVSAFIHSENKHFGVSMSPSNVVTKLNLNGSKHANVLVRWACPMK